MVIANEFKCQTDSDTIEKAIQNRSADGIAIGMGGDIKDSSFVNVINKNPNEPMFAFGKKKRKYFINVKKENFVNE